MIRADQIPEQLPPDISKQETIELELAEEEQALLYALDAEVEDAATFRCQGEMFEVCVAREVPQSVVAALKRAWEAGGWIVGAFELMNAARVPLRSLGGPPDEYVFRLVFARPFRDQRLPAPAVMEALEARREAQEFEVPDPVVVERIASGRARTATPLLVRLPTRARPAQALEVLAKYRDMATEHVAIEVVIDEDDQACNNTQFLQRLAEIDCFVTVGRHKTKIEACNGGRVHDWGVIVLASDDMVPVSRGYDQKILTAMEQHFPLLDGAINFNDGYNRDHVRAGEPITNTIPIYGRYAYEQIMLGRIYHPQYRSIYCDTDATFVLNRLNRMVFLDEVIIEHRHFANAKARFDELYQHNSRHDEHDRQVFEARHARDFDVALPTLSLLICSIAPRRKQLERLVDYLRWQIGALPVEICVDLDGVASVGAKRQRLLERAVGRYVCFIDDDDWVDARYVERVLDACAEDKDCCSLVGVITENGVNPRRFEHSAAHSGWYTREDGVYIRTPNHLNAIRRELALQVGFVSKSVGEDHDFSARVRPLIKSEAQTGSAPLYYYWSMPAKSVQSTGGAR